MRQNAMKRLSLTAFVVLVIATLVFAALYRHKREQQRVQQFFETSTAISNRFEGYATALKNADFVTAYRYFGAEFQRKTSLETFREQQLRFGTIIEIQRGATSVQTEHTKDSPASRPVGVVVAKVQHGADTGYFTFKFEKEKGDWKIVSILEGKGQFEGHLRF
jgi:hypothetical protein